MSDTIFWAINFSSIPQQIIHLQFCRYSHSIMNKRVVYEYGEFVKGDKSYGL